MFEPNFWLEILHLFHSVAASKGMRCLQFLWKRWTNASRMFVSLTSC
ncbi:hypothetical protein V6Z12_D03G108100 [Gossypium hirsutum]